REPAPRPEPVIVIGTTLPVPAAGDAAGLGLRRALVDAARIEVVRPGTDDPLCSPAAECSREFRVDEASLRRHDVSFGVVDHLAPAELRVRLFNHDLLGPDGE